MLIHASDNERRRGLHIRQCGIGMEGTSIESDLSTQRREKQNFSFKINKIDISISILIFYFLLFNSAKSDRATTKSWPSNMHLGKWQSSVKNHFPKVDLGM